VMMSPDGRYATVLAQDGRSIALIDIDAARVERTIDLPQPADLAARVMVASRLLVTSREKGSQPTWLDVPMPAGPEPVETAAAEQPPPQRPASPAAAPETTKQQERAPEPVDATPTDTGTTPREVTAPPPQAFPPAPTVTAAVASEQPVEQAGAPEESKKTAESPATGSEEAPQEVKPAEPAPGAPQPQGEITSPPQSTSPDPESPPAGGQEPPPAESPSAAAQSPPPGSQEPAVTQGPFLSGHVRGEIPAGLQVLFYGPDNVLRLGAGARGPRRGMASPHSRPRTLPGRRERRPGEPRLRVTGVPHDRHHGERNGDGRSRFRDQGIALMLRQVRLPRRRRSQA